MDNPVLVNLGCGTRRMPNFINVDIKQYGDTDIVVDLNKRWPFEDNSVDHFFADNIVEHLYNQNFTMNEAWRCLKMGGLIEILVPSTDGMGAFRPGHVSYWNLLVFNLWVYDKLSVVDSRNVQCRYKSMEIKAIYLGNSYPNGILHVPFVYAILEKIPLLGEIT